MVLPQEAVLLPCTLPCRSLTMSSLFQPSGFSYTHTYGAVEGQGSSYWEKQRQKWYKLMWETSLGDPRRREYEMLANAARKNRDDAYRSEAGGSGGPAGASIEADDLATPTEAGIVTFDTPLVSSEKAPSEKAPSGKASPSVKKDRARLRDKDAGFSNTQLALAALGVVGVIAVVVVAKRRTSAGASE